MGLVPAAVGSSCSLGKACRAVEATIRITRGHPRKAVVKAGGSGERQLRPNPKGGRTRDTREDHREVIIEDTKPPGARAAGRRQFRVIGTQ